MTGIEAEIIYGILEGGKILHHIKYSEESTVEIIIVKYEDEVYQVVKHDGKIVNFMGMMNIPFDDELPF